MSTFIPGCISTIFLLVFNDSVAGVNENLASNSAIWSLENFFCETRSVFLTWLFIFEEDDFENIPRRYGPIGAVLRSCREDVSVHL